LFFQTGHNNITKTAARDKQTQRRWSISNEWGECLFSDPPLFVGAKKTPTGKRNIQKKSARKAGLKALQTKGRHWCFLPPPLFVGGKKGKQNLRRKGRTKGVGTLQMIPGIWLYIDRRYVDCFEHALQRSC